MVQLKCIQKIKDKNGNIVVYILQCINGAITKATSSQLKKAIQTKQADVVNLKLTKDNRLIDKETQNIQTSEVYVKRDMIQSIDLTNKSLAFKSNINLESFKAKAIALGAEVVKLDDNVYVMHNRQNVIMLTDKQFYFAENSESIFSKIKLESLNIKEINTSKLTNMSYMFCDSKIHKLDLSNLKTSNVKLMHGLFEWCDAYYLSLKNFDTHNVTDMSSMFEECISHELDLSAFNTSKVTNMRAMFKNCSTSNLDIRNFDTHNVTDMTNMFCGFNTEKLGLRHFDTSNVDSMIAMFARCKIEELDLSSFNTSKVKYMNDMFSECSTKRLDLSSFDTSRVESFKGMFSESEIEQLDISNFRINKELHTSTEEMFKECTSMKIKTNDDTINKIFGHENKRGKSKWFS